MVKDKLKEKILEIVNSTPISLSISEVTERLKEKFNITISPQITKRNLLKLKKEGKIN